MVARSRSRLSARLAMTCASRHVCRRLSARHRSRATGECCAKSGVATTAWMTVPANLLDIDEHPAAGEYAERPRTLHEQKMHGAHEIELQIRDARDDLDKNQCRDHTQDDACGSRRPGGDREEH